MCTSTKTRNLRVRVSRDVTPARERHGGVDCFLADKPAEPNASVQKCLAKRAQIFWIRKQTAIVKSPVCGFSMALICTNIFITCPANRPANILGWTLTGKHAVIFTFCLALCAIVSKAKQLNVICLLLTLYAWDVNLFCYVKKPSKCTFHIVYLHFWQLCLRIDAFGYLQIQRNQLKSTSF